MVVPPVVAGIKRLEMRRVDAGAISAGVMDMGSRLAPVNEGVDGPVGCPVSTLWVAEAVVVAEPPPALVGCPDLDSIEPDQATCATRAGGCGVRGALPGHTIHRVEELQLSRWRLVILAVFLALYVFALVHFGLPFGG
jgi:hypothetical protein